MYVPEPGKTRKYQNGIHRYLRLLFFCRPNCNNTLFNTWESLLNETESDAQAHTDIAGVLGRAVSRPLLEKTFHMKIQSRTVFLHRESFDSILDKTEQMLLKVSTFWIWIWKIYYVWEQLQQPIVFFKCTDGFHRDELEKKPYGTLLCVVLCKSDANALDWWIMIYSTFDVPC